MNIDRRGFLKSGLGGLAYFSTAATTPAWIAQSAQALCGPESGRRRLIIIQQSGGNDGLNTVIPYTDTIYTGSQLLGNAEIRPSLKILEPNLGLTLLGDGLNAFHPKLVRLKDWYANGNVAVIQNVGYPNPNLSHFTATDLWEFGRSPGSALPALQGWMSRFFDNQCAGMPAESIEALSMIAAGIDHTPVTLNGSAAYTPPSVRGFSSYAIDVPSHPVLGPHFRQSIEALNGLSTSDPSIDFLQRSANLAAASVEDMVTARQMPVLNPYPAGNLGDGLNIVSKIIRAGFDTKIFYVFQGGYDTHANQFQDNDPVNGGDHPRLLDEFDQAINSFLADMEQAGELDDVLIMTFSEFGRRAKENASFGTDHGAANCLFLMGGFVNGGVYGGQPDLANLLGGNLRHSVDFRAVYSIVIRDWFNADPEPIFGSADFNDPVFGIAGAMERLPILTGPPVDEGLPALSRAGTLGAVALAAAAGALVLRSWDATRTR